jgi:hypothetical protein
MENPAYEYHVTLCNTHGSHPRYLGMMTALAMKKEILTISDGIHSLYSLRYELLIADTKPKPKPLDTLRKEVNDCLKQKYCTNHIYRH